MEDFCYIAYDLFARVRDAIADAADEVRSFIDHQADRALCWIGWALLHIAYLWQSRRDTEVTLIVRVGQWLAGDNF